MITDKLSYQPGGIDLIAAGEKLELRHGGNPVSDIVERSSSSRVQIPGDSSCKAQIST
jgi:hypothetical protein